MRIPARKVSSLLLITLIIIGCTFMFLSLNYMNEENDRDNFTSKRRSDIKHQKVQDVCIIIINVNHHIPAGSMLGHRCSQCSNLRSVLGQRLVFFARGIWLYSMLFVVYKHNLMALSVHNGRLISWTIALSVHNGRLISWTIKKGSEQKQG